MFVSRTEIQKQLYSAEKALIVHCCSFAKNGSAFVCGGISTAGKSTLCWKMKDLFTPINDEKNLLEFGGKSIIVRSYYQYKDTPEKKYLVNHELSAELAAFLFVEKEYEVPTYMEKLNDKAKIWKRLLKCVAPPVQTEPQLFPNYFSMLEKLMSSTKFFVIHHDLSDSAEFIASLLENISK